MIVDDSEAADEMNDGIGPRPWMRIRRRNRAGWLERPRNREADHARPNGDKGDRRYIADATIQNPSCIRNVVDEHIGGP